jgi:hypothetical protein
MTWQDVLKHVTINSSKQQDLGFFLGTGNETVEVLDEILIPYLQCYEIQNFGALVSVSSKQGVTIYLIEPSKQSNYRMMKLSMIGDAIYQVAQLFTTRQLFSNQYIIVYFLPVFGCLGDSAWNCIPTVYSVIMGSWFKHRNTILGKFP